MLQWPCKPLLCCFFVRYCQSTRVYDHDCPPLGTKEYCRTGVKIKIRTASQFIQIPAVEQQRPLESNLVIYSASVSITNQIGSRRTKPGKVELLSVRFNQQYHQHVFDVIKKTVFLHPLSSSLFTFIN